MSECSHATRQHDTTGGCTRSHCLDCGADLTRPTPQPEPWTRPDYITTRIEQARAEEREACALAISGAAHELCEHSADPCDAYVEGAEVAIAAIRARAKETL